MRCPDHIAARIDWSRTPWSVETVPDGRWGTNSRGNDYVKFDDGSYQYFNRDNSRYLSDGRPGDEDAPGSNVYISPTSERYYTPSEVDQRKGRFFLGIDFDTGREKIYWEDASGNIAMTLRKNIPDVDALPRKLVRIFTRGRDSVVAEVGEDGQFIARNTGVKPVPLALDFNSSAITAPTQQPTSLHDRLVRVKEETVVARIEEPTWVSHVPPPTSHQQPLAVTNTLVKPKQEPVGVKIEKAINMPPPHPVYPRAPAQAQVTYSSDSTIGIPKRKVGFLERLRYKLCC